MELQKFLGFPCIHSCLCAHEMSTQRENLIVNVVNAINRDNILQNHSFISKLEQFSHLRSSEAAISSNHDLPRCKVKSEIQSIQLIERRKTSSDKECENVEGSESVSKYLCVEQTNVDLDLIDDKFCINWQNLSYPSERSDGIHELVQILGDCAIIKAQSYRNSTRDSLDTGEAQYHVVFADFGHRDAEVCKEQI